MQARINERDLRDYFAREQLASERATETALQLTGEALVARRMLTRVQLLQALQLQDRHPERPLGHCVAALGYASGAALEPILEHRRMARLVDVILELEAECN